MKKGTNRKSIEYLINENGCHICTSHKTIDGNYPSITINGKMKKISRLIFELFHRPLPVGYLVRHKCDNRRCINPYHLEMGTYQDNVKDMIDRGRQNAAKGEKSGMAKLTDNQAKLILSSNLSSRELAKMFNVHMTTIQGIRNGSQWKHLKRKNNS